MFTLRATWMRGGTSKCWLFNAVDVDPLLTRAGGLDALLISAFGSGDPRQLDGVGGGSSTTSKAAIVRRSASDGIDVDYLFAQVAIGDRRWNGAATAATAPPPSASTPCSPGSSPSTTRSPRCGCATRTPAPSCTAEIATPGGAIPTEGNAPVPGTNALGVAVGLMLHRAVGQRGRARCRRATPSTVITAAGQSYAGTMVVAGAPAALFDAADLGLTGAEDNGVIAEHLPLLVALRQQSSLRMGLIEAG